MSSRLVIEQKCDRLKELMVSFIARADRPPPRGRDETWLAKDKADAASDVNEAVRLGLDLVKQVIVDLHQLTEK